MEILDDVLYFTRIPKTGSENLVFLISELSKVLNKIQWWFFLSFIFAHFQVNNFTHYRYGQPDPRHLSKDQQENHARSVLMKKERPLSYDRHVHFIDFSQFSTAKYNKSVQPIWFSIIRDPVDKFVSRYHYNR